MNATPAKLKNGTWGARVQSTNVRQGDTVTITTKAGKRWDATVSRVIWTGDGFALCATASADSKPSSPRIERKAPWGRTCRECGSERCSKAWDPTDLCDED